MNESLLLVFLMLIADMGVAVARLNSARPEEAKRRDDERMTQALAESTGLLRRLGLFALMCGSYYVLTELMKWTWIN